MAFYEWKFNWFIFANAALSKLFFLKARRYFIIERSPHLHFGFFFLSFFFLAKVQSLLHYFFIFFLILLFLCLSIYFFLFFFSLSLSLFIFAFLCFLCLFCSLIYHSNGYFNRSNDLKMQKGAMFSLCHSVFVIFSRNFFMSQMKKPFFKSNEPSKWGA